MIENFKSFEFKYNSWQDETIFNLNVYDNKQFLDVKFNVEIEFDSGASEDINKMKLDMIEDEKSLGNQTELTEIFAVPNIIEKTECEKEKNSGKVFLYLIL